MRNTYDSIWSIGCEYWIIEKMMMKENDENKKKRKTTTTADRDAEKNTKTTQNEIDIHK